MGAAGPLLSLPLSCPVVMLRLRGSGGGIFEQWKTSMRIAAFGFLQLGFDCPRTRTEPSRVADLKESRSVRVANVTNSPLFPRAA